MTKRERIEKLLKWIRKTRDALVQKWDLEEMSWDVFDKDIRMWQVREWDKMSNESKQEKLGETLYRVLKDSAFRVHAVSGKTLRETVVIVMLKLGCKRTYDARGREIWFCPTSDDDKVEVVKVSGL